MGVFDTVEFECLACGAYIEEQTKAGSRAMQCYSPRRTPSDIVASLQGATIECHECNERFIIFANAIGEMYLDKPVGNECYMFEEWRPAPSDMSDILDS